MIYLDIETLDFFQDPAIKALPREQQLRAMRFGIAVTYNDTGDEWREWLPDQLPDLWAYLQGDIVAGWNIRSFDIPVIIHGMARLGHQVDASAIRARDLFYSIRDVTGRWYKLEEIAQSNLGRGKSADGQQAAVWLREWQTTGDIAPLRQALDYCQRDVELERDLYRWLYDGKPLLLPHRPAKGEINPIMWRAYPNGNYAYERIPDALGAVSTK